MASWGDGQGTNGGILPMTNIHLGSVTAQIMGANQSARNLRKKIIGSRSGRKWVFLSFKKENGTSYNTFGKGGMYFQLIGR